MTEVSSSPRAGEDPRVDLTDMATQVAEELRAQHIAEVESGNRVLNDDDEAVTAQHGPRRSLLTRIEFRWRDSDRLALEQVQAAANRVFLELFDDAITVLDRLYATLRVPEQNEHGVVRKDAQGRPIWRLDDYGQPVELWSQLTGDDIERCLLDIARLRFSATPQVNNLLAAALFAKRISTDVYDDAYIAMIDGTIQDKTSKANRKARSDSYHAFFRYVLWSQGDVFLREIHNFQRLLERVREWQTRAQWR